MTKRPEVHRYHGARTEQQRKADFNKTRPSSWKAGYNARWNSLRAIHKARYPLCAHCLKGDTRLMYDESNLQSLCKSCHSRKTATEDSGFSRR